MLKWGVPVVHSGIGNRDTGVMAHPGYLVSTRREWYCMHPATWTKQNTIQSVHWTTRKWTSNTQHASCLKKHNRTLKKQSTEQTECWTSRTLHASNHLNKHSRTLDILNTEQKNTEQVEHCTHPKPPKQTQQNTWHIEHWTKEHWTSRTLHAP